MISKKTLLVMAVAVGIMLVALPSLADTSYNVAQGLYDNSQTQPAGGDWWDGVSQDQNTYNATSPWRYRTTSTYGGANGAFTFLENPGSYTLNDYITHNNSGTVSYGWATAQYQPAGYICNADATTNNLKSNTMGGEVGFNGGTEKFYAVQWIAPTAGTANVNYNCRTFRSQWQNTQGDFYVGRYSVGTGSWTTLGSWSSGKIAQGTDTSFTSTIAASTSVAQGDTIMLVVQNDSNNWYRMYDNVSGGITLSGVSAVPEPSSMLAACSLLVGPLGFAIRRKK